MSIETKKAEIYELKDQYSKGQITDLCDDLLLCIEALQKIARGNDEDDVARPTLLKLLNKNEVNDVFKNY